MAGREYSIFAAGIALAILHVLDDAFVNKQPETTAADHLVPAAAVIAVLGLGLVLYPRARPGVRAALAVGFGVLILVAGGMHVAHALVDEAERSDFTGWLAAAAGVVLIALGLTVAWRAPSHPRRGRRWARRALVAVGTVVVVLYVLVPVGAAIYITHTPREPVAEGDFSLAHEDVTFVTSDGLTLRGWYTPSRNGAAIVLVHGSGGTRKGPREHAKLLAEHGYGVLLYDARGAGESDGDPLGFNWTWSRDVDAAVEFLKARPDVRDDRVGGVGLSSGADALAEASGRRDDLLAVVAEGAGVRGYGDSLDLPNSAEKWLTLPYAWLTMASAQVLSGTRDPRSVGDFVTRAKPGRLMLIAAGHGVGAEEDLNPLWARRTHGRVKLWMLPEGEHTAALEEEPREYERRVVSFFDRLLLAGP